MKKRRNTIWAAALCLSIGCAADAPNSNSSTSIAEAIRTEAEASSPSPAEAGAPLSEAEARELLKPADGSPPGRAELEQSLPRAKEVLLRLLDDPDPQVRAGAASALGGWAAESDVRISLLDRSKDGALEVGDRSAAILALESVANDVANELLPLLDAREPAEVQVAAVRVLSGVDEHQPAVRAFIDSDSAHAAARRLGMQYLARETTDHSSQ